MEVISQHRPFWTTKIGQSPPVVPRLMKFSLPSLSTDRHFPFDIGFSAYPKPHLTHLNAKLWVWRLPHQPLQGCELLSWRLQGVSLSYCFMVITLTSTTHKALHLR